MVAFINNAKSCFCGKKLKHLSLVDEVNHRGDASAPKGSRGMRFWVFFENVFTKTIKLASSTGAPREFRLVLNTASLFSKEEAQNVLAKIDFSRQSLISIGFDDKTYWEKFKALPDNDFQGRLAEVVDASKRKYNYSSILSEADKSKFVVVSREPEDLASVLGSPSGTYGKLKLDGVDIEPFYTNCQITEISSHDLKSALVHEVKTSVKGDLVASFRSALGDKFFMMSKLDLTKYLVSHYGIGDYTLDPTTLQKMFVYYGTTPQKVKPILDKAFAESEQNYNTHELSEVFQQNYKELIQKLVDNDIAGAEINVFAGLGLTKSNVLSLTDA